MDQYQAYAVEKARASGAGEPEIQETVRQMESFKKLYANPFFNAAVAFLEPFPVGLLVTLISAAVLRKRAPAAAAGSRSDPGLTAV